MAEVGAGLALSACVGAGCTFTVSGVGELPSDDAGEPPDLAVADVTVEPKRDLAEVRDLAAPPDLAGLVVPSFLPPDIVDANAAALDKVSLIDTSLLQIARDGGPLAAPPAGVGFRVVNGIAVLTVGKMTIERQLRVVGGAPLAIIAADEITVGAELFANATFDAPGPGGYPPGMGPGAGPAGVGGATGDTGGAGARLAARPTAPSATAVARRRRDPAFFVYQDHGQQLGRNLCQRRRRARRLRQRQRRHAGRRWRLGRDAGGRGAGD
jgi:hypothetical protein